MDAHGQLPLFTIRGAPYNAEQMTRDLRVAVLEHMGLLFGLLPVEDEFCPECDGALRMVMHPHAPTAFCECGWILHVDPNEIDEEIEL
jgi:hypothetical protein